MFDSRSHLLSFLIDSINILLLTPPDSKTVINESLKLHFMDRMSANIIFINASLTNTNNLILREKKF